LVEVPEDKKALHNKGIYQLKEKNGGTKWYRARLIMKRFQQWKGIDFTKIFSLIVKLTTIRSV